MARVVLLTKTRWTEPPRLRHQFARLLTSAGHEVLFFEKAVRRPGLPRPQLVEPGIRTATFGELFHHRLRLTPALHRLDGRVARATLASVLECEGVSDLDAVVNFNYDAWYVRDLFPRNRIITIINDDFLSGALLGYQRPYAWVLARTCSGSDHVLTVSQPLQRQLAPFARAELFLPWADRPYTAPTRETRRDLLLYWGYINRRLDLPLMIGLARELDRTRPELKLRFVGPLEPKGVRAELSALAECPNVEISPSAPLDELPLERVLASLIPYVRGVPEVDAATLPNKALQMLARGIPLLISGMPSFMESEFVFRLDNGGGGAAIDELESRFQQVQPAIRRFVSEHTAGARLEQFERLSGLRPLPARSAPDAPHQSGNVQS